MTDFETAPIPIERVLEIAYTNHRGEYAVRHIVPIAIWFGATDWHPQQQWLLKAHDVDRKAERDFALSGIGNADGKIGQAYQVVGMLLSKSGDFDSEEGTRALNYFADEKSYDDDFLPWPRGNHDEWAKLARHEAVAQSRVAVWMMECFGPEITSDKVERADRFIEEALELAQATGWTADRGHALVDYVFSRPVGQVGQEVGGVMVTLAALCNVFGVDIATEIDREVDRITQPEMILKIRSKQAGKPVGSALPVPAKPAANARARDLFDKIERLRAAEYRGGGSERRVVIEAAIRDAFTEGAR